MTIKSVVIRLPVDYLEQAAKERGISRTKLVRIVMEKVIRDELVSEIVSDDDLAADTPQLRYRRFHAWEDCRVKLKARKTALRIWEVFGLGLAISTRCYRVASQGLVAHIRSWVGSFNGYEKESITRSNAGCFRSWPWPKFNRHRLF